MEHKPVEDNGLQQHALVQLPGRFLHVCPGIYGLCYYMVVGVGVQSEGRLCITPTAMAECSVRSMLT